jgi:hypothetical protein
MGKSPERFIAASCKVEKHTHYKRVKDLREKCAEN